jgi:cytidylate kinase
MELFDIDRPTAERRRRDNDRMRIRYVRRTYGVDLDDPDLYHLRLDSTVLDPETCVELIVTAARARTRGKAPA